MLKGLILKLKLIFIPCKENEYLPRILGSRFLAYFVIALLALKIFTIPLTIFISKNIFFADITKNALIELTNKERQSLGFKTLKENFQLDQAAYLKAQDMLEKDYFSHNSPTGLTPWSWLEKSGYNYKVAGENLAIGFLDSEEAVQAWMDSPSHRSNILNKNYNEMGIAVLKGEFQGNEVTLAVQFFGSPDELASQKISAPKSLSKATSTAAETPEKEIQPQKPEPQKEVASVFTLEKTEPKNSLAFNLGEFASTKYNSWLKNLIYGSLIFIVAIFLITIFLGTFIHHRALGQYKDITLRASGLILVLIILLLLDKTKLVQLIPHNFSIY